MKCLFVLALFLGLSVADRYNCIIEDYNNVTYDFSSLYKPTGYYTASGSSGATYYTNICGTTSSCQGVGVVGCNSQSGEALGLQRPGMDVTSTPFLSQSFSGGQPSPSCPDGAIYRQFFICDPQQFEIIIVDSDPCDVMAYIFTSLACDPVAATTTGKGNSNSAVTGFPQNTGSTGADSSTTGSQGPTSFPTNLPTSVPTPVPTPAPTPAPTQAPARTTVTISAKLISSFVASNASVFNLTTYDISVRTAMESYSSKYFGEGSLIRVYSTLFLAKRQVYFTVVTSIDVTATYTAYTPVSGASLKSNVQAVVTSVSTSSALADAERASGASLIQREDPEVGEPRTTATTYLWRQRFTSSRCSSTPFSALTFQNAKCASNGYTFIWDEAANTVSNVSCTSTEVASVTYNANSTCTPVPGVSGLYEQWAVGKSSSFPYTGGAARSSSFDSCSSAARSTEFYAQFNPSSCIPIPSSDGNATAKATAWAKIACQNGAISVTSYADQFCRKVGNTAGFTSSACYSTSNAADGPAASYQWSCPAGDSPSNVFSSASTSVANIAFVALVALIALF